MNEPSSRTGTTLAVQGGRIHVFAGETNAPARLSWPPNVTVAINDTEIKGTSSIVRPGDVVEARLENRASSTTYDVRVASDRMSATLTVRTKAGVQRTLTDAQSTGQLELQFTEQAVEPPTPTVVDANVALQREGVAFGVRRAAIEPAVANPGVQQRVAKGREPVPGRDGSLQLLIDPEAVRFTGVEVGTPLIEVTPKRNGVPGTDVTGRELGVAGVKGVRIRLGQ